MRIAYVLPFPELNGGNKVIFQHAGLLRATGHEVVVLADGPRPEWIDPTLPYHRLGHDPLPPRQDLVIGTFWTSLPVARALDLGPLAHFCQGYEGDLSHLRGELPRIEEVYSWPLPALTVSPHLGDLLASRFARPSRTVPPPLDPEFHPDRRRRPSREPWIAVPGIFESDVKDVRTALATVQRLRAAGLPCRLLRFSILPLGDEERALLAPDLYLCGVPPSEVATALRRCDLLLLTSRPGEGFGLPLLEAMASGVPAVASRLPSTAEVVGEALPLAPPGDDAAFAAAAEGLLRSPQAWLAARQRGLEAAQRFHPDVVRHRLDAAVRWAAEAAAPALTPVRARPYTAPPAAAGAAMTEPTTSSASPAATTPRVQLLAEPGELRAGYQSAQPFPHIVLDGLFPVATLEAVLAEFPQPGDIPWRKFESPTEKKLGWVHTAPLGPHLRNFLVEMSAPPVLQFLEALTGIEGLIPDPYFGGAGPHQIEPGGFLKVHTDFNWHPLLHLDRRLNLLVYLNKDWREEYGGHLELWDREVTRCEQRVLPLFNRTVVFSTTDFSYHGHPNPLTCPPGRTRKSVSFYYYTNGRPDDERSAPHDTVFRKTHAGDW